MIETKYTCGGCEPEKLFTRGCVPRLKTLWVFMGHGKAYRLYSGKEKLSVTGEIRYPNAPRTYSDIRAFFEQAHELWGLEFRNEDGRRAQVTREDVGLSRRT